jgi:hypothetical protein
MSEADRPSSFTATFAVVASFAFAFVIGTTFVVAGNHTPFASTAAVFAAPWPRLAFAAEPSFAAFAFAAAASSL